MDRPSGCASKISRQSTHEVGMDVGPTHAPATFTTLVSFLLEDESTSGPYWPEGLGPRKIPMTPSGIKPMTFRFVELLHNQMHHRVPYTTLYYTVLYDSARYCTLL
jgi:hypothetical protein